MSKKAKLLGAGVLVALVLAALPAVASAEEYEAHCPTAPCVGNLVGNMAEHAMQLENDNGEKVAATGLDGTIVIAAATTTTATIELEFTHVFELISGFKFTCNSPGAAAGVIRTGALTTHFINLTTGGTNPAVLITLPAGGITFACAGFFTKTVTGGIIGTITEHNCNKASATNRVKFNIKAGPPFGTQEHELWTGKSYSRTTGTQASDGTTSAQTGLANITWQATNQPTLTC